MPFGVVNGVGRWMGVLGGGGDRRRGSGSFGDFVAQLCESDAFFPNYVRTDLFMLCVVFVRVTVSK